MIRGSGPSLTLVTALLAIGVLAAGCGGDDGGGDSTEPPERVSGETAQTTTEATPDPALESASAELRSSAFTDGSPIPVEFTCDGAGASPPLALPVVPAGTESVALLLQDLDAPGGTFLHWSVYGLGPDVDELMAGSAPSGALEGANDAGGEGYAPPCPPEGDDPHRYVFTVHSLPSAPDLEAGASPADAVDAIEAAAITSIELTGTYGR